ncbi:hypothetical protein U1Q18_030602 [Sarracenia purpurea var. burkii]
MLGMVCEAEGWFLVVLKPMLDPITLLLDASVRLTEFYIWPVEVRDIGGANSAKNRGLQLVPNRALIVLCTCSCRCTLTL